MARAYISGKFISEFAYLSIRIKTRPNRVFNYDTEIWAASALKKWIADEEQEFKLDSNHPTDVYDELIQVQNELKESNIVIHFHDDLHEIFIDKPTISRYDAEVAIKQYLERKGHNIKSIKWKRN